MGKAFLAENSIHKIHCISAFFFCNIASAQVFTARLKHSNVGLQHCNFDILIIKQYKIATSQFFIALLHFFLQDCNIAFFYWKIASLQCKPLNIDMVFIENRFKEIVV